MAAVLDEPYLGFTLLITIAMQLSFFLIAYYFQFDKVTDLAGTTNFVLLAVLVFLLQQVPAPLGPTPRSILITVMVGIWGLRLGAFLLNRVIVRGKDDRFDEMRSRFWAFLGFWIFQIIWVWVVSIPVTLVNASLHRGERDFNSLDWVGFVWWLIGFLAESWADQAKYRFTQNPGNRGKWIDSGIWSWSRHPNYFGELSCWFGIFLISLNVCQDPKLNYAYIGFLSPLLTYLLLMFVSGMPGAEKRSDEKFGRNPEYLEYKASTSPLIPMPKSFYRVIPESIKANFLFEFRLYSKYLPNQQHDSD